MNYITLWASVSCNLSTRRHFFSLASIFTKWHRKKSKDLKDMSSPLLAGQLQEMRASSVFLPLAADACSLENRKNAWKKKGDGLMVPWSKRQRLRPKFSPSVFTWFRPSLYVFIIDAHLASMKWKDKTHNSHNGKVINPWETCTNQLNKLVQHLRITKRWWIPDTFSFETSLNTDSIQGAHSPWHQMWRKLWQNARIPGIRC